ncbi:MAG: thioesterase family protein [Planctomycetota bacterium]|nr:thioesterase family protein [Planctomycetota bacterium]
MKGHAQRAHAAGEIPAVAPATSGALRLRVRYVECDPMGVAHHAAYVPWLEAARTELLRTSGVSYAQLEALGVFLVVVKLDVRYRRPVLYDDIVEVRTRVRGAGRVKIEHEYDLAVVERAGAPLDEVVAAAFTTLACVDREGRVAEVPAWLRGGA